MQRYICPVCERPYLPSKRGTFPAHGKHWVNRPQGSPEPSGWAWCDGANEKITEETKKHEPTPSKGRP